MKESWNFGLLSGIKQILRGRVRGGGSGVALKVIQRLWGGLSGYHKCGVRTSTSALPSREDELCVVLFDTQGVKVMTLTGTTGMEASELPIITRSRLVDDLRKLGVLPGQVIMLHASVKAIGWIVGGPDMVIQALLDVLTPGGTLMMYVGWEDSPYELAQWPEDRQRAYLKECPPFDPARSRAYRQWSILAEYLRTWPGACRSHHPDASFAAVGSLARWITENHPLQYGYGPGSPLAKLCETGGRILLLGAPLNSMTLLHYAEHLARMPGKQIVRYKMPILRDGQRVWVEIEEFDTNQGIGGRDAGEYFETIAREFLSSGKGRSAKVGGAQSYLFDAADLTEFATEWLEREFGKG